MSDEFYDNPVIVHAIELDGVVYPPILQACMNCSYCRTSEIFAEDEAIVCDMQNCYVDLMDWCQFFDLNLNAIPDELDDYLEKHEELFEDIENGGLLPEDYL